MFSEKIDSWYSVVKRILFKYKNGFFELPIMSNSPETTIGSITKMPFVRHDVEKQVFGTRNPIMNADIQYYEIEHGLWFMHSKAEYKENVHYIRKNDRSIPSDYYRLFIEITRTTTIAKTPLVDGIPYANSSWVFLNTSESNTHCRFKGDHTTSLLICMNKQWVKEQLFGYQAFLESDFKGFFESNDSLLICAEDIYVAEKLEQKLEILLQRFSDREKVENGEWRSLVWEFLDAFLHRFNSQNTGSNFFQVSQVTRRKIIHAEQYLIDHIRVPFIGITELSKIVGLSPTKLKADFKVVFGDSAFQYFRKRQMEMARSILMERGAKINELADEFGYNSPSKFTAAYKGVFNVLPSDDYEEGIRLRQTSSL